MLLVVPSSVEEAFFVLAGRGGGVVLGGFVSLVF